MWSFFSRDPTKGFPYEVLDEVPAKDETSIWKLHKGKKKDNGDPVSIFVFDVKSASEAQTEIAKASMKRMKTLRHPNLLTYLDGMETDKVLYVVTEKVMPLTLYQETLSATGQSELSISWGLHQVVKGLSFLINDCNLVHNNVCLSSVFVDLGGEWKLGALDFAYLHSDYHENAPIKILPALERYNPPETSKASKRAVQKWSTDGWGLGCLVWEVFNGQLQQPSNLKILSKIPKSLVPQYGELVSANPNSRPNPAEFIKKCRGPNGFMCNKLIDTMEFLEEIQIKDVAEKNEFFSDLSGDLDSFLPDVCQFKILPHLLHAFEFGNAGAVVLTPLFKLGKLLDTDEYQKRIVPCIVKLFSSTDRATRVKLLEQAEFFVEHVSPALVNDKIFPNVVHGFNDTNPYVRDSSVKSMLHIAPKLNFKNLNEELLKHFARLQAKDDQGGIRTNTTFCLGKIACHLNPQVRQKVLGLALIRGLKDPFPPARLAAVGSMANVHNLFSIQDTAARLVPALAPMLVDPEKKVRDQAFTTVKQFLEKLERVSENPDLTAELERDVLSGGVKYSSSTWTGWAVTGVSSLTSKLYRGKGEEKLKGHAAVGPRTAAPRTAGPRTDESHTSGPSQPSSQPSNQVQELPSNHHQAASPPSEQSKKAYQEEPVMAHEDDQGEEGGWGQDDWDAADWGSLETAGFPTEEPQSVSDDGGWKDEDWGSLEDTASNNQPAKSQDSFIPSHPTTWGEADFVKVQEPGVKSSSSLNWDNMGGAEDFFSSVLQTEKKPPSKMMQSQRPTRGHGDMQGQGSNLSKQQEEKTVSSQQQQQQQERKKPASKSKQAAPAHGRGWDDWGSEWTEKDKGSVKSAKDDTVKSAKDDNWDLDTWDEKAKSGGTQSLELEESQASRTGKPRTGALKLGAKKLT